MRAHPLFLMHAHAGARYDVPCLIDTHCMQKCEAPGGCEAIFLWSDVEDAAARQALEKASVAFDDCVPRALPWAIVLRPEGAGLYRFAD